MFAVTIENWTEWDLNAGALNSVEALSETELSSHELDPQSEPTLSNYSNFISLSNVHILFWALPSSFTTYPLSEISHM